MAIILARHGRPAIRLERTTIDRESYMREIRMGLERNPAGRVNSPAITDLKLLDLVCRHRAKLLEQTVARAATMFKVGDEYTREEIQAQVGGGLEIFLPNKAGVVVAACLTKDKNPRAPSVILCGVGEDIAAAGAMLARQSTAIPVFIKRGTKRWQYIGNFRPSAWYTSGPEFESRIAGSGRDRSDISRVVVMTPAAKT